MKRNAGAHVTPTTTTTAPATPVSSVSVATATGTTTPAAAATPLIKITTTTTNNAAATTTMTPGVESLSSGSGGVRPIPTQSPMLRASLYSAQGPSLYVFFFSLLLYIIYASF